MKNVALAATLSVLTLLACGARPGAPAAKWPIEATGPLTEADMANFVKSLPALNAALKAAGWTPTPPKLDDTPVSSLATFVEGMDVPGVDESLRTAGSNWSAIRATLYKVFAASAALRVDNTPPEAIAEMRKDTSLAAKKGIKDFEHFRTACAQIPAANKQVVIDHQEELQALQTLGQ